MLFVVSFFSLLYFLLREVRTCWQYLVGDSPVVIELAVLKNSIVVEDFVTTVMLATFADFRILMWNQSLSLLWRPH